MRRKLLVATVVGILVVAMTGGGVAMLNSTPSTAMQAGHDDGGHDEDSADGGMSMRMEMVPNGTVVNENEDELPPGCDEIAGEREVTIRGGVEHSDGGEMFSFDRERLELEPCTRVNVTFANEDDVRHQWMIHGLPSDTYPMGMFNIEVHGPAWITATFITPSEDTTMHTHCSLPQHEQKGMAMSVIIGDGGDSHGHGDGGGSGHDH